MDQHLPVHKSLEKTIDYSKAIVATSMEAVYRDVAEAKCQFCEGKIFPTGPITLSPPEGCQGNFRYKLMFVFCTECSKEGRRLYALDLKSQDYINEQSHSMVEIPRWSYLVGEGNPVEIDVDEE